LRVVVVAAGISRRVYIDTRVISIAIIVIYTMLTEKIGTPLIILVSDFHYLLGEHPQIHPRNSFLFSVLSRKSLKKIRVLSFAIA
jgi:hypothetical protein